MEPWEPLLWSTPLHHSLVYHALSQLTSPRDEPLSTMGGAIELLSPPSSPIPGRHSFVARTRYRPSLTTLGWILLYAATFLFYQYHLRLAGEGRAAAPRSLLALDATAGSSLATTSCEVCHLDPSDPLCEYGLDNIRLSRAYEGSGARLRRVLQRALKGEEIRVGVIGASVTQGHGVPQGKQRWEDRWFDDFQKLFPKAKMTVGAVPATDSRVRPLLLTFSSEPVGACRLTFGRPQFFSYCFEAVVPKDLDLYLVELDVNNAPCVSSCGLTVRPVPDAYEHSRRCRGPQTLRDDDALMRGLLQLPQEPAVVRVSAFTVIFPELARGAISSLITSQHFDVPVIGVRNFLLPQVIRHRETAEEIFGLDHKGDRDYRHIGHVGHAAMADMLSLFVRKEVCEAQRRDALPPPPSFDKTGPWPDEADLGKIPDLAVWSSVRP